jgi:hypothetical protein
MPAYPIRPKPDDDKRFTFGLIVKVGAALVEHGYPPVVEGADGVRLELALYRFLYGDPE